MGAACSPAAQVSPASPGKAIEIIAAAPSKTRIARPPVRPQPTAEEMKESHARRVAELGIHPTYHDAPAPPLVWPSWLVHVKGAEVRPYSYVTRVLTATALAVDFAGYPRSVGARFLRRLADGEQPDMRESLPPESRLVPAWWTDAAPQVPAAAVQDIGRAAAEAHQCRLGHDLGDRFIF